MRLLKILLVLALFAPMGGAGAHEVSRGKIILDHFWARTTVGTARPGVAYLTIINTGKTDDALIGIKTAVARRVHIHRTVREGGIMRMVPVERLPVPAGGRAVLQPGGTHLMLMGLKAPLELGDTFQVTLIFEKAGAVVSDVYIEATAGSMPPKSKGGMKGMNHGGQ
jgi:copper(I)-binding protein